MLFGTNVKSKTIGTPQKNEQKKIINVLYEIKNESRTEAFPPLMQ